MQARVSLSLPSVVSQRIAKNDDAHRDGRWRKCIRERAKKESEITMGRVLIPVTWNEKNVIPLHTENRDLF